MNNLWSRLKSMNDEGINNFGMLGYLGYLSITAMLVMSVFSIVAMHFTPLIMLVSNPLLEVILGLIAGFFIVYWSEPKIISDHELHMTMIVEGVIALILFELQILVIIQLILEIISILMVIWFVAFLVQRYGK